MAGKAQPIKVRCFIGDQEITKVPEDVKKRMSERLSRDMSEFYSLHPDLWKERCRQPPTAGT